MAKKFTVTYERDEDGWWTASIDRAQGASCVTQGRSLFEARKRIREALALHLDVDEKAVAAMELVDDIKLSAPARTLVERALEARDRAKAAQEHAIGVATAAARRLTDAGLSTRDAAEVLGVSHQLIHNYVKRLPSENENAAPRAAAKRAAAPRSAKRPAKRPAKRA